MVLSYARAALLSGERAWRYGGEPGRAKMRPMSKPVSAKDQELPSGLLDESGRDRLHIGGTVRKDGWKVLNALPGDHVDFVGDVRDLSQFSDASFDVVYGSHIMEHLGYNADLPKVVGEIARILRPGGRFFVSVPDLETLCRLFLHPQSTFEDRYNIMRMMFGGQVDQYDYHYVGLWDQLLVLVLFKNGFANAYRVPRFPFFNDTSATEYGGIPISVNLVAVK